MSSKFTKVAAVAASTMLVVSGASAANAQIAEGSLGSAGENAPTENGSGSLKAWGLSPESGSLLRDANHNGTGSLDTTNSSLGEPTLGSLADLASQASGSVNISAPKPGTGSVDTTGSALVPEPTTGSLAGLWAPIAGSLGIGTGITTVVPGSAALPTGSLAAVLPIVLVGGSIAAGIAAAPLIQQALANANFQIPGLPQITLPAIPGLPPLPGGSLNMPQPPAKAPQGQNPPGPNVPNGRG